MRLRKLCQISSDLAKKNWPKGKMIFIDLVISHDVLLQSIALLLDSRLIPIAITKYKMSEYLGLSFINAHELFQTIVLNLVVVQHNSVNERRCKTSDIGNEDINMLRWNIIAQWVGDHINIIDKIEIVVV